MSGRLFTGNGVFPLDFPAPSLSGEFQVLSRERTPENVLKIAGCMLLRQPFGFDGFPTIPAALLNKPDLGAVFFTSGTTSEPKAVALTRKQMEAAAYSSAGNFAPEPDDAWLLCMPLHHVGGCNVILRAVHFGTDIRFLPDFDADAVSQVLGNEENVAFASLVPTQLFRLLQNPGFRVHKKFKALLLGGGPAAPSLIEEARRRDIPVIFSYGMTETCGQVAATRMDGWKNASSASTGPALPGVSITIADAFQRPLPKGAEGLIWVKAAQVFDGYATQVLNENRFDAELGFCTNDWGRFDETGALEVLSRREDLIVTGGENVAPAHVEHLLVKSGLINDAVVVGVPDLEWGQAVAAVVSGNPAGELTLRAFIKEELPGFMRPKSYFWNLEIPRNQQGKILRTVVRQRLTALIDKTVSAENT
jgi:O-succinylbenzoic acid--CoA ligase